MRFLQAVADPHEAAQARLQKQVVQWKGQQILCPGGQRLQAQVMIGMGGQDQHGRRCRGRIRQIQRGDILLPRGGAIGKAGDAAAQIKAVAIAQTRAQQHEVRCLLVNHFQGLGTGCGLQHVVERRRQPDPQQDAVCRNVIHDQDFAGHGPQPQEAGGGPLANRVPAVSTETG